MHQVFGTIKASHESRVVYRENGTVFGDNDSDLIYSLLADCISAEHFSLVHYVKAYSIVSLCIKSKYAVWQKEKMFCTGKFINGDIIVHGAGGRKARPGYDFCGDCAQFMQIGNFLTKKPVDTDRLIIVITKKLGLNDTKRYRSG